MALKILMVGGRRCGKTSALASTFDEIINGPVKNIFTIADRTSYTTKTRNDVVEKQDVLSDKQLELENKLEEPSDNYFLVDANPTYNQWTYKLALMIPGKTGNAMELEFTDVPGEWFTPGAGDTIDEESGKPIREVIQNLISDTDVFVVMVDTPFLMHQKDSVAKAANSIAGIQDYMTHIKQSEAQPGFLDRLLSPGQTSEKLVIFSPIKCEKWVKEDKMDEVVAKMERMYDTMLTSLKAHASVSICVIPIETAGNIQFFEYSDPTILAARPPLKCKKETDDMVRLADGSIRFLDEKDVINPDPQALMAGNIMRPYTWYEINQDATGGKLYQPRNCEQIPLHILQFMLNKFKKGAFSGLLGKFFSMIFGTIPLEEIEERMAMIRNGNLLKNNVDNIRYIKNVF